MRRKAAEGGRGMQEKTKATRAGARMAFVVAVRGGITAP